MHGMTRWMLFSLVVFTAGVARAADVDYARDIKPIFAEHCYQCHGPDKQKQNFRLDQRAWLIAGGDSGEPAILPGESGKSHLIRLVTSPDPKQRMPREGDPLTEAQIGKLKTWIDAGAPMPGDDTMKLKRQTDHWSFQPIGDPAPPRTRGRTNNPIDAFLLARLEEKDLDMSAPADRRTLIRRLYGVMHGLAPTPRQIEQFLADQSPDAYENLVEQVLASPRYGERWAQHWLDVVRYADTHGFEMNQPRPDAFHYRDWVIEALNRDLPYDRFVYQQLAGDTVGVDAATGFLVAGPQDQVKGQDPMLRLVQRTNELDDIVSTTSQAFLGLTVGCARCHNHKFDPVSQKDYYALKAVFEGVQHGSRPMALPEAEENKRRQLARQLEEQIAAANGEIYSLGGDLGEQVNTRRNVDRFEPTVAKLVRFTVYQTNNGAQPCIDELEVYTRPEDGSDPVNVALASAGATAGASSLLPGYDKHQIHHLNDGKHGNLHSWISNEAGKGWAQIELAQPVRIDRIVWGRDREANYNDRIATSYVIEVAGPDGQWRAVASSSDRKPGRFQSKLTPEQIARIKQLKQRVKDLEKQLDQAKQRNTVYAGRFTNPPKTHRLYRGDPMSEREIVTPQTIEVLGSLDLPDDPQEQRRRVAFANWVIDPDNPLTARVMVNRLWQHHFGVGLVDTPSDFGGNGAMPTHPKLLDWLAREFMRSGWSLKHMHRLILTSRTFRQSTEAYEQALSVDRKARLLWRYPSRRLSAEAIRDSMLQVAGVLDLSMGGPGFSLFKPNDNYVRVYDPKTAWGPDEFRRMVYMHKVRMEGGPVFGAFDCPDAGQPQPERPRSTTAIQSLNLFNSSFTMTVAGHFAERLIKEAGTDPDQQIERAYQLMYGRTPTTKERDICRKLIDEHSLTALTRVLLNTNEFLFIP